LQEYLRTDSAFWGSELLPVTDDSVYLLSLLVHPINEAR
jgi:hypothetical protein